MSAKTKRLQRAFEFAALPVVLVVTWGVATRNSTDFFVPPLTTILGTFPDTWFTEARFTDDVLPSLGRLLLGYAAALVIGISGGLVIGINATIRSVVEPVQEFLRAIPPPVMVPVLMLLVGINSEMRILVILFGCVWPILLNTAQGVRSMDSVHREVMAAYRCRLTKRLTLRLRYASPQIFAGARVALSLAVILMVISEMFAASDGIGFTVVQFQRNFAIPEMWSGVILLGTFGLVLSLLFRLVESYALRWFEGMRRGHGGAT